MKTKMHIHYDPEADYLEVRFGKTTPSYFEDVGDDIFESRDEKTGQINGYALFNVMKRKKVQNIDVDIPTIQ